MVIRLLFINFKEEDIPTIPDNLNLSYEKREWREDWGDLPALHDYHVIITDLHDMVGEDIEYAYKKAEKFSEQVETGGYLVIFSGPDETYKVYRRYKWIPHNFLLAVVKEAGKSVIVMESVFRPIFDSFSEEEISWDVYFKCVDTLHPEIVATTRGGYPISIQYRVGKGKVVLLPVFSDRKRAIKVLIEKVLPKIFPDIRVERLGEVSEETPPGWVGEYVFERKRELMERIKSEEEEVNKYTQFERLLYSHGIQLVRSVALALEELGFEVEITAEEGTVPDLEIRFDEEYEAIAEVKGLRSPLKIEHLRQLLHYYIDKRDIEQKVDIKAVFFVNHQRDRVPKNRDKIPCTETALKTAEKHGMAIISTYDLYEALRRIVCGKISEEEIRDKIITGEGYVSLF